MTGDEDDDPQDGASEQGLTPIPTVERQAAALAFLPEEEPLRFVLVTSRRTQRWIFPKGGIGEGLNGPTTAVREAWEEAGVIGPAATRPVGSFRSRKIRPPHVWELEVEVFPVEIREIRDDWPEQGQRLRRFVTLAEARPLLADPEMVRIVERFAAEHRRSPGSH